MCSYAIYSGKGLSCHCSYRKGLLFSPLILAWPEWEMDGPVMCWGERGGKGIPISRVVGEGGRRPQHTRN